MLNSVEVGGAVKMWGRWGEESTCVEDVLVEAPAGAKLPREGHKETFTSCQGGHDGQRKIE